MLRSVSNKVSPLMSMRPRAGRRRPAMAFTTEVLPAPDRPKSAVTPSPPSNDAARRNSPSPRSMSTDSIFTRNPTCRPAHQDLGEIQSTEREQHGEHAQAQRRRVAGRSLRIGVARKRQRARLPRNVRNEGNGRAELPEAPRKGKQYSRNNPGKGERQRHREEHSHPACAQGTRRGLEPTIDQLEREPDRANHQREAHDACRERRAGPTECNDNAEPLLEDFADGAATAEEKQQEKPHHNRRQHQRQVNRRVEQRLAREGGAGEDVGDRDREGQADEHAPERDAQAEPEDLDLFGREAHSNPEPGLSVTEARPAALRCRALRQTPPCSRALFLPLQKTPESGPALQRSE